MVKEVNKYALVNAKLRARISKLLSEEFFSNLIKCRSLTEMLSQLRQTSFAECADIYEQTGDIKLVELLLYKREAFLFLEINRFLPADCRPLSNAYAVGYELENLKNALRLFFDHTVRRRPIDDSIHYLMRDKLINDLPFEKIINSSSFIDITNALASTPYASVINQKIPIVQESQSLFPLTISLDKYYYRQLLENVAALSSRDQHIANRLIGIEIDLQNINWIIRFRSFYRLPEDTLFDLIIPGGFAFSSAILHEVYRSEQVTAPLEQLLHKRYPKMMALLATVQKDNSARLSLIEQVLDQIMLEEVQRLRQGYPFTVGIVLSYYILKRREIKRIRTVLNAGFYEISKERIAGLL